MEANNKKNEFLYMRNAEFLQNGLNSLIAYVNSHQNTKELNMIEIGSYLGESTIMFAQHFNSVVSIDPFMEDYDPNDDTCNYAPLGKVFDQFKQNTKDISNIIHLRETSDEAINKLPKKDYFLVYIDGLHTYEQVKKDIANYRKLIPNGGFICGHDYSTNWQGVKDAIDEAFGSPDMVFQDTSWIKRI